MSNSSNANSSSAPPPLPPGDESDEVVGLASADTGESEVATTTAPASRQFPCGQCGAKLEFKPGVGTLECNYCGHSNVIPVSEADIIEIDFHAEMERLAAAQDTEDHVTARCDGCGASVEKPPNVTAMNCPFCAHSIVSTGVSTRQIKPASLLPFKITRDDARDRFQKWLHGLWFAPSILKQAARVEGGLNGVYLPYWTYDSDTITFYTGQRGDAYYVTRTRTRTVNGKTVTETYQERRIRWRSVSGTVCVEFDDVLVPASTSLPAAHADGLEPWDLPELKPYADEYLSGFGAESYTVGLPEGFGVARGKMDVVIRNTIRRDIGGDEQRIGTVRTQHNHITFKHILLPLWISAYRYQNKAYRFLINGRTGKVRGERPWSWAKLAMATAAVVVVAGVAVYLIASA